MDFLNHLVKRKYSTLASDDSFHERDDLSGHDYCRVCSREINSGPSKSFIVPTRFWVLTTFFLLFVLGVIIGLELSIRDSLLRNSYGRGFSTELSMSFSHLH